MKNTEEKHPDFDKEQACLSNSYSKLVGSDKDLKLEIESLKPGNKGDKYLDKEHYSERAEINLDIARLKEKADMLKDILGNPYFGKIVLSDEGPSEIFYIGKNGWDKDGVQIINWQAPIAELYYSNKAHYSPPNCSEPKIVNLHSVHSMLIKKDLLENLYDKYIQERGEPVTHDGLLHEQIKRSGKSRLTYIYATIQSEQNEIIRAKRDKHMVIQGSAGTGKTIVMLYRVAYLIYNNRDLDATNILFLSPSFLFSDFVKSILPDIDLQGIDHFSTRELIEKVKNKDFREVKKFPHILEIDSEEREIASDAAVFKTTTAYKQLLDEKISECTNLMLEGIKDFVYRYDDKTESIAAGTIKKWFLEDLGHLSLNERKKAVRAMLRDRLNSVLESSSGKDKGKARSIFSSEQSGRILNNYFAGWPDMKRLFNEEILRWYKDTMVTTGQEVTEGLEESLKELNKTDNEWKKYFAMMSLNDWGALYYLYQLIMEENKKKYKIIVIDEAQILSPLWLFGIKRLLDKDGIIILTGDLNQKTALTGKYDWTDFEEVIGKLEVKELTKCYRLTDQIASYAMELLDIKSTSYKFAKIGREGEDITVITDLKKEEKIKRIGVLIKEYLSRYETFAIVGRTNKDCEIIYRGLKDSISGLKMVVSDTDTLDYINVLPVSIVRGMEFDVVVILDHKLYDKSDEFEVTELYLAVTRAIHKLILA